MSKWGGKIRFFVNLQFQKSSKKFEILFIFKLLTWDGGGSTFGQSIIGMSFKFKCLQFVQKKTNNFLFGYLIREKPRSQNCPSPQDQEDISRSGRKSLEIYFDSILPICVNLINQVCNKKVPKLNFFYFKQVSWFTVSKENVGISGKLTSVNRYKSLPKCKTLSRAIIIIR